MTQRTSLLSLLTGFATLALLPVAQADDLLSVYQAAVVADPQYKSAEANYNAVAAVRSQSVARLLPSLNLSADASENSQDIVSSSSPLFTPATYDYNVTTYTLSLSQAVFRQDYFAQLRQSNALKAQAEAQYKSAEQALAIRVADQYFKVLAAIDNLEFAKAEKTATQRQLEQTKQRFNVGLIAITDVHEVQASYDAAVAQEIVAENLLTGAREALSEITGLQHETLLPLKEEIPLAAPDPADIDQWIATALAQNFDLIAAEAATRAAQRGVSLARAGHYPAIDIYGRHTYTDTGGGSFGSRETEDTSVGVELNLSLFQGGGVSARSREAQYRLTQAQEFREQERRSVIRQTRDGYLTVVAAISEVQALKQSVISSQSALKAVQAGYEVGTRTIVDVLDAQREMLRTQRNYFLARYTYLVNTLKLKQAAGMLTVTDVEQINGWLKIGDK